MYATVIASVVMMGVGAADGTAAPLNTWRPLSENQVGPRWSPGLVWSAELKRFVLFGGRITHQFKGQRPYDVQSLDLGTGRWQNDLPTGAEKRGAETGFVTDPGFNTPYFALKDKEGVVRPNYRQFVLWHHYAYAPWDGKVYVLVCGRTLRYDPAARVWKDLKPPAVPVPATRSTGGGLSWGAMCADPINKEIVLFGGGGLATERVGPGTWVYSTERNTWRKLDLEIEPPVRALSPMVFDRQSKRIVLFGGDRLDMLYADTWVYDPATRRWEERKPPVSPSPRFGHALLYLPGSGKVVLLGGKHYTSSLSYLARLYKPLPFEMWTYDVSGNAWRLIRRFEAKKADASSSSGQRVAPPLHYTEAAVAAADDGDNVLLVGLGTKRRSPHSTWTCAVDATATDEAGTAKHGVKPGTTEVRTGSFDPEWYTKDVPAPDPEAAAAVLENLPANKWVALRCPRWPRNRQGGGWSTTAFDPDTDQILHLGGGHSSYFGNDVAHYDIRTGRWSISYRPQFALEHNYGLSGPGPWAFNLGPWGNHNYQAYAYDPTCKRLVYIKDVGKTYTQLYEPVARVWRYEEKILAPFYGSKYTTYLCPTPKGMVAWAPLPGRRTRRGLWRLEGGKAWKELPVKGDALPTSVCDGSTLTYDSKRDRLLFTTTTGSTREETICGQVWAYDFETGTVRTMDPTGMAAVKVTRFARESVYLPAHDMIMLGYLVSVVGRPVTLLYDCAANRWVTADLPGAGFIAGRRKVGCSVDLGLAYDAKRDVVWGVLCRLRPGALNVLRLRREGLPLEPLK